MIHLFYQSVFFKVENISSLPLPLTNTTNERDYIYQDLIHSTAVKDVIGVVKDNLMLALVGAGFGLLLGIIIGLAIGHVKL